MKIPTALLINKKAYKKLVEVVDWLDKMPKHVGEIVGESFHEDMWEYQQELVDIEALDLGDEIYMQYVEKKGQHFYAVINCDDDFVDDDRIVDGELRLPIFPKS